MYVPEKRSLLLVLIQLRSQASCHPGLHRFLRRKRRRCCSGGWGWSPGGIFSVICLISKAKLARGVGFGVAGFDCHFWMARMRLDVQSDSGEKER